MFKLTENGNQTNTPKGVPTFVASLGQNGSNLPLQMAARLYEIDIQNGYDNLGKFSNLSQQLVNPLARQVVEEGASKAKALSNEFTIKRKTALKSIQTKPIDKAKEIKEKRVKILERAIDDDNFVLDFSIPKRSNVGTIGVSTHSIVSATPVKKLVDEFDYVSNKIDRDLKTTYKYEYEKQILFDEYTEPEIEEAKRALSEIQQGSDKYSEEKERSAIRAIFLKCCAYLIKISKKDADMELPPIRLPDRSFEWDKDLIRNRELIHHDAISICADDFKTRVNLHQPPVNPGSVAVYLANFFENQVLVFEWICTLFLNDKEVKEQVISFKGLLASRLESSFNNSEHYLIAMTRNSLLMGNNTKFDYYRQNLPDIATPTMAVKKIVSFDNKNVELSETPDGTLSVCYVSAPFSKSPDGKCLGEERTESVTKKTQVVTDWSSKKPDKGRVSDKDSDKRNSKSKRKTESPDTDGELSSDDDTPSGRTLRSHKKILKIVEDLSTDMRVQKEQLSRMNGYSNNNGRYKSSNNNNTNRYRSDRDNGGSHRDSAQGPKPIPPKGACDKIVRGQRCEDPACTYKHGKFTLTKENGSVQKYCKNAETRNGRGCLHIWGKNGCYYNHYVKNV